MSIFDEIKDDEWKAAPTQKSIFDDISDDEWKPSPEYSAERFGGQLVEGSKDVARQGATGYGIIADKLGGMLENIPATPLSPIRLAQDYYQKVASPTAEKVASAEPLKQDPKYQESAGFWEDVVRTGPQVLAQIGTGLATGPAGPTLLMGSQIAGSTYESEVAKGVDKDRAAKAGIANAIMQAPLESLGLNSAMKLFKTRTAVVQKLKDMGSALGKEWLTEFLQAYPDAATSIWAENADEGVLGAVSQTIDKAGEIAKQGAKEGLTVLPFAALGASPSLMRTSKTETKTDTQETKSRFTTDLESGKTTVEKLQAIRAKMPPNVQADIDAAIAAYKPKETPFSFPAQTPEELAAVESEFKASQQEAAERAKRDADQRQMDAVLAESAERRRKNQEILDAKDRVAESQQKQQAAIDAISRDERMAEEVERVKQSFGERKAAPKLENISDAVLEEAPPTPDIVKSEIDQAPEEIAEQRTRQKRIFSALSQIWDTLSETEQDKAIDLILPKQDPSAAERQAKSEQRKFEKPEVLAVEAQRKLKEAERTKLLTRPDFSQMKETGRWAEDVRGTATVAPPATPPSVAEAAPIPETAPVPVQETAPVQENGTAAKTEQLIPQFKTTNEAVAFGEQATPGQVAELERLRSETVAKEAEYKAAKDFSVDRTNNAFAGQLYREALEASRGEHPLQRDKRTPDQMLEDGKSKGVDIAQQYDNKLGELSTLKQQARDAGGTEADIRAAEDSGRRSGAPEAPATGGVQAEAESGEIAKLRTEYEAAKNALDSIGPEPTKLSNEQRYFGSRGREGAPASDVAEYDAAKKKYATWQRKYSKLKKAEVEASNRLFYAERDAKQSTLSKELQAAKDRLTNNTGSSQIATDILNYGIELKNKGIQKYSDFLKKMKSKFADVWDKIKGAMKALWDSMPDIRNERGEIRIGMDDEFDQEAYDFVAEYYGKEEADKQFKGKNIVKQAFTDKEIKQLQEGPTFENLYDNADTLRDGILKAAQGYDKQGMRWWDRAFSNPQWLAEKYASMKTALGIEEKAQEKRTKGINAIYSKIHEVGGNKLRSLTDLQQTLGKDKNKVAELRDLIWKWDGKPFSKKDVPTKWYLLKKNVEGDLEISLDPKHYEEVSAYLDKEGVDKDVAETFLALRKTYDELFMDASNQMFRSDPETDIQELRSEIDKVHNYFPHRRRGRAYVTVEKNVTISKDHPTGKIVVYREQFEPANKLKNRPGQVQKRAADWLKQALQDGAEVNGTKIDGKASGYTVTKPKAVEKLPDEVFFAVPIENMQQIIDVASGQIKDETGADIGKALSKAVADVFKSRGWAGHALKRKGIPGHDTEDIFGITFDYVAGYQGFKTKMERAKEHSANIQKMKSAKTPDEFRYVSNYVKDMLANADNVDKAVDAMRAAFFAKYLGGVLKSGIVNLTQNIVMVQPVLSMHTKNSGTKLSKAMFDVRRALYSKDAFKNREVKYDNLTEWESKAVKELVESGMADDQYLKELMGNLPGAGFSGTLKKGMDFAGKPMQLAERFNRVSTGLTAYRIGIQDKKLSHDEAIEFAKGIIKKTHFIYGKMNLPSSMRGGEVRKVLRAGYTFRSFQHNFLLAMRDLMFNQGKEGKIAAAKVFRNFFLVSGLGSLPFFKDLLQVFLNVIGKDDEDAMTYVRKLVPGEMMKDFVIYGVPGLAGIDISGSLGMEFPKSMTDVLGVPYGIYEDSKNAYESFTSGQYMRAMAELPITPLLLRGAERGVSLYTTGQRTRGGIDINAPGEDGPRKITGKEAILKGVFGFQPTSVSKGRAAYGATKRTQDFIQKKKTKLVDRYVNALKNEDEKLQAKIEKEVDDWNDKMEKQGKEHLQINMVDAVRSRMKPGFGRIPKSQRENAMEVYEEWEE